ncbi:MAG: hydrogenase maturation nickel metallochaperone HypA [Okeania sp. SIO3B3]|nr:hydrogenase maturation nickel metallochaperone HypA [Okeania sp. SIO3B3]
MHELGITQNIVGIVAENAHDKTVKRVTLEIGELSAIMSDALEFCFDICSKGTVLEGATLEIIKIPGLGKCRQLGSQKLKVKS